MESDMLPKWERIFRMLPDLVERLIVAQETTGTVNEAMVLDELAVSILAMQTQILDQRDRLETMEMVTFGLMQNFSSEQKDVICDAV